MNFLLKFSMLMAAAALSGCGSALWHPWIDKQVAGASISKQEASLKPIKMVRPSASAPAKHARWWGYWHGWYGYDKETDMKIVFAPDRGGRGRHSVRLGHRFEGPQYRAARTVRR